MEFHANINYDERLKARIATYPTKCVYSYVPVYGKKSIEAAGHSKKTTISGATTSGRRQPPAKSSITNYRKSPSFATS
uniref:Uncharacterized protein n=1 Tax=Panagrolaimus sp. ES5 TaxID=591445 RepID=A0AC34F7N4_9BILA